MIWTLPNILTMGRIAAAPVIALLILYGGAAAMPWAFGLFTIAALTDFFDGWLARMLNAVSPLGKMLDPIADKVMVIVMLALAMSGHLGGTGTPSLLLALPALAIILREILISGLREYLGEVKLAVTMLAKWKTTCQLCALGLLLLAPALDTLSAGAELSGAIRIAAIALLWIAAYLTLASGWDYFRKAMPHIGIREE